MSKLPFEQVLHLASRALENGGERVGPLSVRWDISNGCAAAHPMELRGIRAAEDPGPNFYMEMFTPCRRCDICLRNRANLWTARAIFETKLAARTWFGTLTIKPDIVYYESLKAGYRHDLKNIAPENRNEFQERFAHTHRASSSEVTRWLKRVRKESGASMRYLLVTEPHNSSDTAPDRRGVAHWHCLVHETTILDKVRKKTLKEQWTWGHSRWKLVDPLDKRTAFYICKYLTKALDARVRASIRYGLPPVDAGVCEGVEPPEGRAGSARVLPDHLPPFPRAEPAQQMGSGGQVLSGPEEV